MFHVAHVCFGTAAAVIILNLHRHLNLTGQLTPESATPEPMVKEHETPENSGRDFEVKETILSAEEAEVILNKKFEEDYKISYLLTLTSTKKGSALRFFIGLF